MENETKIEPQWEPKSADADLRFGVLVPSVGETVGGGLPPPPPPWGWPPSGHRLLGGVCLKGKTPSEAVV